MRPVPRVELERVVGVLVQDWSQRGFFGAQRRGPTTTAAGSERVLVASRVVLGPFRSPDWGSFVVEFGIPVRAVGRPKSYPPRGGLF